MKTKKLRRGGVSLLLALVLCLSTGLPAGAEDMDNYVYYSHADYVSGLQGADMLAEVTIDDIQTNAVLPPGYSWEDGEEHIITTETISFTIEKVLWGEAPKEKKGEVIRYYYYGETLAPAERCILALSSYQEPDVYMEGMGDPLLGEYTLWGAIEYTDRDDWLLKGQYGRLGLYFDSVEDLLEQFEGRAPSNGYGDESEHMRFTNYGGRILRRFYATKTVKVYAQRNTKSKVLLTLEPYDFVLKAGMADVIGGKSWDSILMGDGSYAYAPAGSLEQVWRDGDMAKAVELVNVPETRSFLNAGGKEAAVGRIVKGTAALLVTDSSLNYYKPGHYMALSTGMQNYVLVDKEVYPEIPIKNRMAMDMTYVLWDEWDGVDPAADTLPPVLEGSWKLAQAETAFTIYAQSSIMSYVWGKASPGTYFTLSAEASEKAGWMTVGHSDGKGYALPASYKVKGKSVKNPSVYEARKDGAVYRYKNGAFVAEKTGSVKEDVAVIVEERAVLDDVSYFRLAGQKDLWVRDALIFD